MAASCPGVIFAADRHRSDGNPPRAKTGGVVDGGMLVATKSTVERIALQGVRSRAAAR
jgi:hypothetical protein